VHLHAVGVSPSDEFGRDERAVGELGRDLQSLGSRGWVDSLDRGLDEARHIERAGALGWPVGCACDRNLQVIHEGVVGCGQQRSSVIFRHLDLPHGLRDQRLTPFLEFEVEERSRERGERLLEGWDANALAAQGKCAPPVEREVVRCIESSQLGSRVIADPSDPVGRALDVFVVAQHRNAVARQVDVALQDVRALRECQLERRERVLGRFARGAAMSEHERPGLGAGVLEVGVRHGAYGTMRRPMAVLTHHAILKEIDSGRLKIEPFERNQVGAASIDLTLADEIRILEPGGHPIDVVEEADHRELTRVQPLDEPYLLEPGATIHGITRERVTLPGNLCGFLEGRSRFARLGLMIHVTSAMVQPGVSNRQVLEMSNVSGHPLRIFPGVRICQLVLMRTEGEAVYRGRFSDQETV